jgi:MoaA/NifB/PqqE/SkfB family radical SAM enzyme
VSLGSGRSPRCARCHGEAPAASYLSAADIDGLIAAAARSDGATGRSVEFTGPEPFGHPELPALVASAKRHGVQRLRLDTDAVALASPANAGGSIAAGVRHVRFSVLGGSSSLHDALVGEPGALDATLSGVRSYISAALELDEAVSVSAAVPVCRHNVHDLTPAVLAVVEAGADSVTLLLDDGGLDLAGAVPWLTAACDTGVVNAVWVEVDGAPFCLLAGYELHVADTVRRRDGSKVAACRSCELDALCGGWPALASADTLGDLGPPSGAAALAPEVAKARGAEAS